MTGGEREIYDKERISRTGAGDTVMSHSSPVGKFLKMPRWRVWDIRGSSCAMLKWVKYASKCKGAIFARASIEAMPTGGSLVNLM